MPECGSTETRIVSRVTEAPAGTDLESLERLERFEPSFASDRGCRRNRIGGKKQINPQTLREIFRDTRQSSHRSQTPNYDGALLKSSFGRKCSAACNPIVRSWRNPMVISAARDWRWSSSTHRTRYRRPHSTSKKIPALQAGHRRSARRCRCSGATRPRMSPSLGRVVPV